MFISAKKLRFSQQSGFSLVEALVGLAILVILTAGATNGFLRMTQNNRRNQVRGDAVAAGRRVIDSYRIQDITSLPNSNATASISIDINGETFNVETTFCPSDASTNHCTVNTRRHLRVEVAYPNDNNRVYYTTETVFTELN